MSKPDNNKFTITVTATASNRTEARQLVRSTSNIMGGHESDNVTGDKYNGSYTNERGTSTWTTREPTSIIMANLAQAVDDIGGFTTFSPVTSLEIAHRETFMKLRDLMRELQTRIT